MENKREAGRSAPALWKTGGEGALRALNPAAITVALAFATFENVCYLIQNGADRFSFIFFRGFGTGAMHVLCGLIVGGGKMVRFPLIAEEITEYSLLESCFLAALKFF